MKRNFKRSIVDGFFQPAQGEGSLRIPASVRESQGWCALKPLARVILLEMLDVYFRASGWEKRAGPIARDGFYFAWSQCRESISENAFLAARKEILRVGFFTSPIERTLGGAMLFMPSATWRKYRFTESERKRIEAARISKASQVAQHRDRRRKFLKTKTPSRNEGAITSKREGVHAKKRPNTLKKCGDPSTEKPPNTLKKCGDLLLQCERCSPDAPARAEKLNQVRERVRLRLLEPVPEEKASLVWPQPDLLLLKVSHLKNRLRMLTPRHPEGAHA